jgi:hypothetical protein
MKNPGRWSWGTKAEADTITKGSEGRRERIGSNRAGPGVKNWSPPGNFRATALPPVIFERPRSRRC